MDAIVFTPMELLKATYIKRWKGKDGKWHYKYHQKKKPKSVEEVHENLTEGQVANLFGRDSEDYKRIMKKRTKK